MEFNTTIDIIRYFPLKKSDTKKTFGFPAGVQLKVVPQRPQNLIFGGNDEPHLRQIFSTVRGTPCEKAGLKLGGAPLDWLPEVEGGGLLTEGWLTLGETLV